MYSICYYDNVIKIRYTAILFCFLIISCTPGLFFIVENSSGEPIELYFSICDDLLNSEIEKSNYEKLEDKESCVINFSVPKFLNRGVTQNDYLYTETFLSIFESIFIRVPSSNIELTKIDLSQNTVRHEKKGSSNFYILMIDTRDSGTPEP